ncbi:MAG: NOL1/NOP2/sun family putative RNA methylase [Anaerolineae bacterium]
MPHYDLDRYRPLLSADDFARLQESIARPLPPALRVNTLKIAVETARAKWPIEYGWQIQDVPFCNSGWQISGNEEALSRTIEHRTGFYYIQDAASMLPAEMFKFDREFPLILDMAASPGGKTTHLISRINDRGVVIANDSSAGRIAGLRSNLQTWGTLSSALTSYPGERFGEWWPDTFDYVLLDAPCSGESLRTAERRKTRFVSAKERLQLQQRQIKLLHSAFQAVKPGGQVVYATCTLAPEEDEAVIDALLESYPHAATLESVANLVTAPALTHDGELQFGAQVQHAVRLWPHLYDTSGFFAALIRKCEAIEETTTPPPQRTLKQASFEPITSSQEQAVFDALLDRYGFQLRSVLEHQQLRLFTRSQSVYAIPQAFITRFADFPCIAVGMLIGEWLDGTFIPSHELIARFSAQFTGQRFALDGEHVKQWLHGLDLRSVTPTYPIGSVILIEDERQRFIGRGKVLRDRLRNLSPKK